MLALSRKTGEQIQIGERGDVVITILGVRNGRVHIGIEAPPQRRIQRSEMAGDGFAQRQRGELASLMASSAHS